MFWLSKLRRKLKLNSFVLNKKTSQKVIFERFCFFTVLFTTEHSRLEIITIDNKLDPLLLIMDSNVFLKSLLTPLTRTNMPSEQ